MFMLVDPQNTRIIAEREVADRRHAPELRRLIRLARRAEK